MSVIVPSSLTLTSKAGGELGKSEKTIVKESPTLIRSLLRILVAAWAPRTSPAGSADGGSSEEWRRLQPVNKSPASRKPNTALQRPKNLLRFIFIMDPEQPSQLN